MIKENIIYKIIIGISKNKVFIKSRNYFLSFKQNDLSNLAQMKFNTIDEAYQFILNKFEENNVIIKDIKFNEKMIISIKNEDAKEIELILTYNNENNDIIMNEINELKKEIIHLKEENNILKKDLNKLKKFHENPQIQLLSDIVSDSYAYFNINHSFCAFKSINNILYLIYANKNKSIICYNLNNQKKINEIKNCHNEYITNFRHYLDKMNKRDLIMSISAKDNNIKVWNINNWDCFINITNINKGGFLNSSCFLNEGNQIYIITSNYNPNSTNESIKVFDFYGQKIKEINKSKEKIFFIDTYYDKILSKNYIITGNKGYIKSYDFNKNELYHKYNDNSGNYHISSFIRENKEIIRLIESCNDGNIRIWNFHSGTLLNKIKISNEKLIGIYLWNDNYLFVGCKDRSIKLVELNKGLIIKSITGHNDEVITVKMIVHNKYGECLISQNWCNSKIKFWKINY